MAAKRGEILYLGKRNILKRNEIFSLKTLTIAKYDRNTRKSIFQETVFGEKGTSTY